MPVTSEHCAGQILNVVPLVMRTIRVEMRQFRRVDLSVSQFRALMLISDHPEASVTDVAEHIGLKLPSISRLVDGLVTRQLITRQPHAQDRRRMMLVLTQRGKAILDDAHQAAQNHLAKAL